MEKSDKDFGLCPVCKQGRIIKTNRDYVCTNRLSLLTLMMGVVFHFPCVHMA